MAQRWAQNGVTSVFVLFSTDELIHARLPPSGAEGEEEKEEEGVVSGQTFEEEEEEERQRREEGGDKRLTKEKR